MDPDCTAKEYCGKLNKIVGEKVVELMLAPLKDRPDLIEKVKPDYPIGTKRVALETGAWMGCLLRPNVELLDGWGVEELTEHGAILRDPQGGKKEEEFDVIIYGTGFYASKFLHPMRFKGVGGKDLHEFWAGDARAYAGGLPEPSID